MESVKTADKVHDLHVQVLRCMRTQTMQNVGGLVSVLVSFASSLRSSSLAAGDKAEGVPEAQEHILARQAHLRHVLGSVLKCISVLEGSTDVRDGLPIRWNGLGMSDNEVETLVDYARDECSSFLFNNQFHVLSHPSRAAAASCGQVRDMRAVCSLLLQSARCLSRSLVRIPASLASCLCLHVCRVVAFAC